MEHLNLKIVHLRATQVLQSQLPRAIEYSTHCISGCEVDAEASSPRGQEEDEDVGSLLEVRNHVPSLVDLWAAIEPHERVLTMRHVLLQEVDHSGHLRVNEDAVAVSLQLGQEAVEDKKFSGVKDESFFV